MQDRQQHEAHRAGNVIGVLLEIGKRFRLLERKIAPLPLDHVEERPLVDREALEHDLHRPPERLIGNAPREEVGEIALEPVKRLGAPVPVD